MLLAGFLAALAAICSFVPYLSIYYIIREILYMPDMSLLNVSTISVPGDGWPGWNFGEHRILLLPCCVPTLRRFRRFYELKVAFADHIMQIPLGYHLTLGSGKMRKIMDENIESVEKVNRSPAPGLCGLAGRTACSGHQFFSGIDWRYGTWFVLVGIVLAFIVQFAGFNGEAKGKNAPFPDRSGKHEQRLRGICARYVGDQSI